MASKGKLSKETRVRQRFIAKSVMGKTIKKLHWQNFREGGKVYQQPELELENGEILLFSGLKNGAVLVMSSAYGNHKAKHEEEEL